MPYRMLVFRDADRQHDPIQMTDLLPRWPLLMAFLAASLILAITPGPGVLYIVTRSLTQGRTSGLASVAGVALGNLTNAMGAALGLAAWFAVSSLAFTITKYAGATYLIYLGIRTLFAPVGETEAAPLKAQSVRRIFRDAFFVALLNPKTTLFFAAFLPQFMGTQTMSGQRGILLGSIFVLIAATTDSIYALAAGVVAPKVRQARRLKLIGKGVSGGVFLSLGLYTAFGGTHRPNR
jgi:threonine/homoserine/homoserine lactone efflux protein